MAESGNFLVSIPRLSMHTGPGTNIKPVHRKKKHRTQLKRCFCDILTPILAQKHIGTMQKNSFGIDKSRFIDKRKQFKGRKNQALALNKNEKNIFVLVKKNWF